MCQSFSKCLFPHCPFIHSDTFDTFWLDDSNLYQLTNKYSIYRLAKSPSFYHLYLPTMSWYKCPFSFCCHVFSPASTILLQILSFYKWHSINGLNIKWLLSYSINAIQLTPVNDDSILFIQMAWPFLTTYKSWPSWWLWLSPFHSSFCSFHINTMKYNANKYSLNGPVLFNIHIFLNFTSLIIDWYHS